MPGGILLKNFLDQIEKGLIRFVVVTIVIMAVIQGVMSVDPIRLYLSWGERMEGETIQLPVATTSNNADLDAEEAISPQARVAIEINQFSSLPRAQVLVNGKPKANFTGKRVNVTIQAGDTIEVDATAYNFPIDFNIAAVSSNLAFPEKGQVYTANQAIVMIGKSIVK